MGWSGVGAPNPADAEAEGGRATDERGNRPEPVLRVGVPASAGRGKSATGSGEVSP
jgi:hypothetical protein